MQKLTKIVATIGPATEEKETIKQLIEAGMNVARFNTKHSEPDWHSERLERVRQVAQEMNAPIATLLDLQGPEIRINVPGGVGFAVAKGETVIFTSNDSYPADQYALVPQEVVDSLSLSDLIILEDGASEFIVVAKDETSLTAQAVHDCKVNHRKTMNTPGVVLDMPSLTDRDFQYLEAINPELVDFVGLSFVRDVQDIQILRAKLDEKGYKAGIIAKIENQEALNNIDDIIAHSDAVMVARGDLGVEVPYQELTHWQKTIIAKCRAAAVPVITATQMLKSMVDSPRPTRAEVSDVAHAMYDGTDAVMLSEETTIGKYPVQAVETQTKIAEFNEKYTSFPVAQLPENTIEADRLISTAVASIIHSAANIDKIVCFTHTGKTARMFSRLRLKVPVFAVTESELVRRKLNLLYGITPFTLDLEYDSIEAESKVLAILKENGIIQSGEKIFFIHGDFWQKAGQTNSLSFHTIE